MISQWVNNKSIKPNYAKKYNTHPFPHIEIKDFFKKEKLQEIISAITQEEFIEKEADLFKFMQTNDLLQSQNNTIKELISFLTSKELITFIESTTSTKLSQEIDLFGSLYQNTDFLLCHDDQLKGRKIAFLIYLTSFKKKEGGSLMLYNTKNGKPTVAAKKIAPNQNSLILFSVSKKSFHAVEEIIANKQRITIGGWFHGNK
jgi:prolyl 3-hydroxylase /prolyl 3,4-dihydroxylase